MKIENAEIILKWESGKMETIGTLEISSDYDGIIKAKIRHMWQRLGLELIKKGFSLMFHWGKWNEETD